uniref:Putative secreted protein n=1 Tax=Panstrongylus lignarius TaxID=156445 RepID=A0A224XTG4_9HEMI
MRDRFGKVGASLPFILILSLLLVCQASSLGWLHSIHPCGQPRWVVGSQRCSLGVRTGLLVRSFTDLSQATGWFRL